MRKILNITIKDKEIPVTLIKSSRKSIVLEIIESGDIVVKAPYIVSGRRIKEFVTSKSGWLNHRLEKINSIMRRYPLTHGSKIPFMGKEIDIPIDESINIKDKLVKWYRDKAREELTTLVDKYSKDLNITVNKIYIREQKTRWGSCSSRGNLSFNWKIILTKPELIHYLVIHEVCHMIHMNHSREFWSLVERYDQDYRRNRKELKEAGHYLLYFLK